MERGDRSIPDWREGAAYAPLLIADRAVLAWEWLRRNPAYREAAARALAGDDPEAAASWGLHRFENPARRAPLARPMWTAEALDAVLTAEARPAAEVHACDLAKISSLTTLATDREGVRILLTDGWRLVRIDLGKGPVLGKPVRLQFSIAGPPDLGVPLLALRRFEALLRLGHFAQALHRPEPRASRQVLLLRTADALAAGEGQRAIAATLLHPGAARKGWRETRPDLRLQAQRLVRDARANLAGGYRRLLCRR